MDFIKNRLMQDWIWFVSLIREQIFPGILLLISDCVSFCAFKWSVFTFDFFPTLAQGISIVSQQPMILSDRVF